MPTLSQKGSLALQAQAALKGPAPVGRLLAGLPVEVGLQICRQIHLAREGDGGVQQLAPLLQIQLLALQLQAALLPRRPAPLAAQVEGSPRRAGRWRGVELPELGSARHPGCRCEH